MTDLEQKMVDALEEKNRRLVEHIAQLERELQISQSDLHDIKELLIKVLMRFYGE